MFVEDLSSLSEEDLEWESREQAAHVEAGLCRLVELAAACEQRLCWGSDGVTLRAGLLGVVRWRRGRRASTSGSAGGLGSCRCSGRRLLAVNCRTRR
jgi:hypothetical protein